jgi:LPS export ABC transporter permease LptF/LPS export ABC transporter permease LptG
MRLIDRLVYAEIVPPTLLSLLVLTFLVFGRELGNLSSLLISRAADAGVILRICLGILPGILVFTIPMSLLIGTLIGMSRLSSDNEITALKASGINLLSLLAPVLFVGSILALANFFLALHYLPLGNNNLRIIKYQLTSSILPNELRPRIFFEDFPSVIFYADEMDESHLKLQGIFLFDQTDASELSLVIAKQGRLIANTAERKLQLHLQDGLMYKTASNSDGSRESVSSFASTDLPVPLKNQETALREKDQREKTMSELAEGIKNSSGEVALLHNIEFHKRLALPMATLIFAFIAPPLAIGSRKSGRSAGFVIALVAVLIYYPLFLTGIRLASVDKIPVVLGVWLANILFAVAAMIFVAYANRDSSFSGWIKRSGLWELLLRAWKRLPVSRLAQIWQRMTILSGKAGIHPKKLLPSRVTDFYIMRGIIGYVILAALACCSLFIILTLFDLADDIARQKIPITLVISYFWYLMPQIWVLIAPISVLIATLTHFAIWEKTSQALAFKAGGISLYRLAVPALILATGLSLFNYVVQESILPAYNQRQDSLRNIIKGRRQTSYKPERKWILGETTQVFNYRYFNSTQSTFVGLNVYTWDRKDYRLISRVSAERGIWNGTSWDLISGWERTYSGFESHLNRFDQRTYAFTEKPDYFRREIFDPKESSKMTYLELRKQISALQKSGYDATELQVELYKKIAFPLSCLIMALVAVPFAFAVGKKGALGGIAVSICVGILYWGTLSLFEAAGDYGLIAPVAAAWGPNVMFGGGGLYRFLGMRT